jgi:hypothetical protein
MPCRSTMRAGSQGRPGALSKLPTLLLDALQYPEEVPPESPFAQVAIWESAAACKNLTRAPMASDAET